MKYHQYQIVGRHLPTETTPEPPVYRMKLCVPGCRVPARAALSPPPPPLATRRRHGPCVARLLAPPFD
jgi:hypothetical protein